MVAFMHPYVLTGLVVASSLSFPAPKKRERQRERKIKKWEIFGA
jgi:hypothetical protein